SFALNRAGKIVAQAAAFSEEILFADPDSDRAIDAPAQPKAQELYEALRLGLGDYVRKCGFQSAIIGLSGGIDSAVTAVLAADALGKGNVLGVAMPSRYSSDHSLEDARSLAANLGIRFEVVSIQEPVDVFLRLLGPLFGGKAADTTEENIQSRVRGMILMALSNKLGGMVLSTGNKSELATGYCTLYGDMAGGLAVLCDVPKVMVYELARWMNREREIIPPRVLTKPPSAELRPNQTDQDSLPPYDVLDLILKAYVEEHQPLRRIAESGFDPGLVRDLTRKIDFAEYKRRQAAPGLKATSIAFGIGRRMPIAQKFKEDGIS
ncbi:MAG: NAD(+) synthase, partial [Verrucomicrobiae bacterium]|nr:NAD(+) synthase [Verrucomicrobiae bacterium]